MWGRSSVERALGVLVLFAAPWLRAQTPAKEQFEDLSRRAQASLDSRPDEAIVLYKQALGIRPDWAEGWLYLGGAFYQRGRYAEATDALRKGIGLAPIFANGWALLGLAESQLDDQEQALADIRKGEELGLGANPQFETAVRVRAAQLLIRTSAFDEALAQLQPLSKYPKILRRWRKPWGLRCLLSPTTRSSFPRRGALPWAWRGRLRGPSPPSIPTWRRPPTGNYWQQYPNEPGVHYAYGLYLMETDLAAALAEFQKEVRNNPKHWPALLAIASLQIRQGTPEQAIETLHGALKVVPAKYHWLCHSDLGRANLDANNVDGAIGELENAVRQMPSSANAHFFLAQAYRQAGRKADADRERTEFEKMKAQQDPLGVPALHPFGYSGKN